MRKIYLVTNSAYSTSDAVMAFESEDDAKMLKDSLGSRMFEVPIVPAEKPSLHDLIQEMQFANHEHPEEATDGKED